MLSTDDIHHPTLTVGQTLGFALDTKTPAKRLPGMSKAEFKESVINLLLKMFNIEHTRDTIVGNPFVRGVSGGERKRVSIAEMMITRWVQLCLPPHGLTSTASTAVKQRKTHAYLSTKAKLMTDYKLQSECLLLGQLHPWIRCIDSIRLCQIAPHYDQHL